MMKKLLALTLSLLLAACCVPALASGGGNRLEKILADKKLVVATSPDYAPYEFIDLAKTGPEAIVGADIALARHLAEQLGVALEIQSLDFDAVLAAVSRGSVDVALSGLVPKEERKEVMDFTAVYYNDGNQVVVINKKDADKYTTLASFAGTKVAAQNGTLQYELVSTQLPGATPELITAIPTAILMLQSDKVAGVALASVVADQYVANYPDLVIAEERFAYESLGVAGAVPKGETELVAKLDELLAEVTASGLYQTWIDEANELASSQKQ
ncbi:MAG: transporter substrate-binding domain-containing protein [Oscillospiraceae bacterium]|jgi:polar amino acid transport system substrate-binding protein|nr:transporter substrate-binding domain-containing protein [Oscillospiraceae bacterium]